MLPCLYYYANRAEIDADLDDESAEYDRLFEQSRQWPITSRYLSAWS